MDVRHFLWLFLALAQATFAIDPTERLAELSNACWSTRDGAPTNSNTIAETADGYLWFGSDAGLLRFDGEHFEPFTLTDGTRPIVGDVSALYAGNDGRLWVGMRFGQAYSIQNGVLKTYGPQDGLPAHTIWQIAQRYDGTTWIQSSVGLFRLEGIRWQPVGDDWGYPARQGFSLLSDRDGALWSYGAEGAFVLRRGATRFERLKVPGGFGWLFSAPDGDVWVADDAKGLINLSHPERRISGLQLGGDSAGSQSALVDREDNLWLNLNKDNTVALARLPNATRELSSARPDPAHVQILISNSRCRLGTYHFLEDREGNLWVPGMTGVSRLRDNKLHSAFADLPNPLDRVAMTVDSTGTVWILGWQSLTQFIPGRLDPLTVNRISTTHGTSAFLREKDGSFLLARESAPLARYSNGKLEPVAMDPALQGLGIQAVARDGSGALWVSAINSGLFQQQGTQWVRNGGLSELPNEPPLSINSDGDRLWLGYVDGRLELIERGRVRLLHPTEGMEVGPVAVVTASSDGYVWVGGPAGVALNDGKRFWKLATVETTPLMGVSGIVRDRDGGLWTNGGSGVTYISPAEIRAFLADHHHKVVAETYNYEDGLSATAATLRPIPTAAMGGDGRIWFTTANGVYWIDPQHIHRNHFAPTVMVNTVVAGARHYSTADNVVLPVLTRNFEVDYSALSLSMPSRVRFKYFLEGVDPGWQDAGSRRQAFYTNVAPGEHRFHVTASNEDGVWNTTGAEASIVIPPAFYQTRWFYALPTLAALLLVWQLTRLRVRQLEKRLRVRLEEREAIARELHDTLFQSTQGLIYTFQGMAAGLNKDNPLRAQMEGSLDRAEDLLKEARDRVTLLRRAKNDSDVEVRIRRAAAELFSDTTTRVSVVRSGHPRPLRAACAEEVYSIAREALVNVRKHAHAGTVEVEFEYARDGFRLRIRDDGRGMDPRVVERQSANGHFGITGMRERARQLAAKFAIFSRRAAGTEIELAVPAAVAYRPTAWRGLRHLQLKTPAS
jgi:signal transduction histidine kinase/ligand-binding sensor domain-containing protein